ncbi:glycosyltransferase family 2 protein [Flavobacterium silvaticum]|uniref:Glycosyltransferase family 2 protein n=1 Tax=Flavobacterium silvaticum TaxID=1852020 RepID=A0A972FQL1_9FLAO|nr:glycosyltransferase family 2 protein [Flavobacterium silvaticum]NMH26663.1 glycosyltransferase family 2 protein [Flavobacterium silvaticum]
MIPEVSIIMPLYNKQNHVFQTLHCALEQTFSDFELIVINDGSTDESEAEVLRITDNRIRYFKTENQGVSAARNLGISKASSNLIAFLDADDFWFPDHLEHLVQLHNDFPQAGILAANYQLYYSEKETIDITLVGLPDFPWRGIVPDYFASSYVDRIAWTSAIAIPKKVLEDVGNFSEAITLGAGEDLDLWIRVALKYQVAFDSKVTAQHNLSADNRISLTQTKHRKFATLDGFLAEEAKNKSLKKFLDLYRAEFALKMKIAGDDRYSLYRKAIAEENLSAKTKFLLSLPTTILQLLYRFKKVLEKRKIRLSAYH